MLETDAVELEVQIEEKVINDLVDPEPHLSSPKSSVAIFEYEEPKEVSSDDKTVVFFEADSPVKEEPTTSVKFHNLVREYTFSLISNRIDEFCKLPT